LVVVVVKTALFFLGVIAGLSFARIPHYYPRLLSIGDDDKLPVGYHPRYRYWINGGEVK